MAYCGSSRPQSMILPLATTQIDTASNCRQCNKYSMNQYRLRYRLRFCRYAGCILSSRLVRKTTCFDSAKSQPTLEASRYRDLIEHIRKTQFKELPIFRFNLSWIYIRFDSPYKALKLQLRHKLHVHSVGTFPVVRGVRDSSVGCPHRKNSRNPLLPINGGILHPNRLKI